MLSVKHQQTHLIQNWGLETAPRPTPNKTISSKYLNAGLRWPNLRVRREPGFRPNMMLLMPV
ncbi:hypothetical protein AN2335V1_4957 (plasmid) [Klebsiella variicola]|uniref:Uncharacterized protein n=1 Tax=Klebsiella variicola TaxID=244366 RepID=A0A9P0YDP4_KLEVA|nr:hypothetical protein AN2335V1_4957 [Klebsiella variicola]